jgi:gliding motility-associated protein GldM
MAGGKETPRQKMIGMMYLVLTALLALNVSKQVLDAFVAIELNIQKGTITQLDRGTAAVDDLNEALTDCPKDKEGFAKGAKIKRFLEIINKVDKETGQIIHEIDELKFLILKEVGEDITLFKGDIKSEEAKDAIVWKEWDKNDPLRPARLNLSAVQSKDNFDVPQYQLIGKNAEEIPKDSKGMKFWNNFKKYRNTLVDLTGTYKEGKAQYKVKSSNIKEYTDFADLEKKIVKMLKSNKINKEDVDPLAAIYQELTKDEYNILTKEDRENKVKKEHWLGRTFAHAPLVGALASLSSLQNEIMSARAKSVLLLKGHITTGQYSFNKILGMAYPETAVLSPGDEFEVSVFMAAFDSDKQPVVKPGQGTISEVRDGMAKLKMRAAGGGEMKISGMVGIADKSGEVRYMPYETKVQVATKAGSISLPELSVLYTNWDNKVVPVTSGMVSSDINVNGGSKIKKSWSADGNKYDGYYVKVNPGTRQVIIRLSGKDRTGKSVDFGSYKYKVKPFPTPVVVGGTISKGSGTKVIVSLGLDSPFTGVNFTVTGGEITVGDVVTSFSGDRVPASAVAKAKIGRKVSIDVFYNRNGIKGAPISSSLKVTQ